MPAHFLNQQGLWDRDVYRKMAASTNHSQTVSPNEKWVPADDTDKTDNH